MDATSATGVLDVPTSAPRSGVRRIVAISSSLVGTHAATSALGLVFWTLAARQSDVAAVGLAGVAVALMTLLGTLGTLGLGTLLIARLPAVDPGRRRVLVRTALALAATTAALLALVVPLASLVLDADDLRGVGGTPALAALFALGTAATAAAIVLDQAVLVSSGAVQLERNVVASVTKIVALGGLGLLGARGGMAIFLAWTAGTLVSLPVTAWRTRSRSRTGQSSARGARLLDPRVLRGLGRSAAGHHALNTTLMASLLLLPVVVTLALSPRANGVFATAVAVAGLVFALPYALSVGLFAAADGEERHVLARLRATVLAGLGISVLANLALFPFAPLVLAIFGPEYAAEGTTVLRVLALAGVPFVIKDQYVALRRVQDRTARAALVMAGFTAAELAAAVAGARAGGTVGLCVAWVAVLAVEAVILAVPLVRAIRRAEPAVGHVAAVSTVEPPALTSLFEPVVAPAGHRVAVDRPAPPQPPAPPPAPPPDDDTRAPRTRGRLRAVAGAVGVGPVLVLMSLGLLAVARAVALARVEADSDAAQAWYVAGLVVIVLPAAVGVLLPGVGRGGRIALAVAMPVLLQLSRLVLHPDRFTFHDELIHGNLLRQLGAGADLFGTNPLLPITAYYPGLELATDAVRDVTGLTPHGAAAVVLVAARVVVALGILALVQRLTGSSRAAAVATVVYGCNPQFLFFNSQYSYQTLALPLAVLTVYLFLSRDAGRRTSLVLPLLGLAAVVLTHHVTAGLLVAGFTVWWLLEPLVHPGRTRERETTSLGVMAVAGAAMFTAALLNPGNTLGGYLGSIAASSGADLGRLVGGTENKELFRNSAGLANAPWEQALVLASLAITVLVLVPALLRVRRWTRARNTIAVLLCLVAALYPIVPGGHLTTATAEVGDRAAGFVFVGVAFAVAWWVTLRPARVRHALLFGAGATVVFLGSAVLGGGPVATQLPGPFRVSADARSVDPANTAAARWMADTLPAETRVYANRVTGLLAASDGGQFTVRHVSTGIDASRLLLDPELTPADVDLIRRGGIRYVIADRRDAFGLPNQEFYIESGEFGGEDRTTPVPAAALAKFDEVPGVDRVYDNGAIAVYDVGALPAQRGPGDDR